MLITAKFPGKCAFCGHPIGRGERIDYEGGKVYHPSCVVEDKCQVLNHDNYRYSVTMQHSRHGSYIVTLVIFDRAGVHLLDAKTRGNLIGDPSDEYRQTEREYGLTAKEAELSFKSALRYIQTEWPTLSSSPT